VASGKSLLDQHLTKRKWTKDTPRPQAGSTDADLPAPTTLRTFPAMIAFTWLDEWVRARPLDLWLPGTIRAEQDEAPQPLDRGARIVDAAKHRIESELDDITVAELWRESRLSRTEFSRVFRRREGVPPRAYLLERKIEGARRLLATDRSLSEIALALGFYDQSHFTRVFKQATGETPAAYRRRTNVQDEPEMP
jgi:AraC-like DNA-binding protein